MLELVRAGGLPAPEVNARLGRFLVDFLWREQRVVLEADSFQWHSGRRSYTGDHQRDLELRADGWDVVRVTREQIMDQPELVLVIVAQALAAARTAGRLSPAG